MRPRSALDVGGALEILFVLYCIYPICLRVSRHLAVIHRVSKTRTPVTFWLNLLI